MDTTFIYALNCPETGRCRYIGKADNPIKRLAQHLCHPGKGYRANWLRSLLAHDLEPLLEILDEVPKSQWQFWEREYIRIFRAIGFELTNGTEGGEGGRTREGGPMGGRKHTIETTQKISAAKTGEKNNRFGIPHTPETKEKIRASCIGKKLSLEHRAAIRKARIGSKRGRYQKKFNSKKDF